MSERILCWFSCGAVSACAAKMTLTMFKDSEVLVVGCDTRRSENEDNYRFSTDCERWFGRPITWIKNANFETVDDVFEKRKYMSGPKGAPCTMELKKRPRFEFQRVDDVHVFGYSAEEGHRIATFKENNPELRTFFILQEFRKTRFQCYQEVSRAGIELPMMYQLGFDNNNCPGCVKASAAWYWDMTRTHFPAVFARRAEQSRRFGSKLLWFNGRRRYLDELPLGPFKKRKKKEKLSCGPECSPNK